MPIGVGLIGLGMATAPHMMSLRELEESGRVRIIGGHAPSATRRDAFTARWDAPVFAEQAALLAAPGLDLVLVLTPPGAHLPVAHAAIAAGKHILVEKPIELTVARGEALAAAAEAAGVRCGVCLQHRFRPAALRLKATLASGALGKPLSASTSIRWWRDDAYFAQPGRGTMARDGGACC
jgi:UDP-N-acetyl-2-amino-2-deoxyglucuronate dehydrogenase